MSEKKNKSNTSDTKKNLSVSNDQLGENAGEGRYEKTIKKKDGKSR